MLKFNYYQHKNPTHICSIQLKSPLFNSNENKEPLVKISYVSYDNQGITQNKSTLNVFTTIQDEYSVKYSVDYSNTFYVYKHDDVLEVAINETPNVSGTIETAYPGLVKVDTYEITDASAYTRIAFNDTPIVQRNRASFVTANTPYVIKATQPILLFIIGVYTNKSHVVLIESGKIHGIANDSDTSITVALANGVTTATFTITENAFYIIR